MKFVVQQPNFLFHMVSLAFCGKNHAPKKSIGLKQLVLALMQSNIEIPSPSTLIFYFQVYQLSTMQYLLVQVTYASKVMHAWMQVNPSLKTQSCIKGLLVAGDFCFWAVWTARPVLKKKFWADYQQLFRMFFFHVSRGKKCQNCLKDIVVSRLKSALNEVKKVKKKLLIFRQTVKRSEDRVKPREKSCNVVFLEKNKLYKGS